MKTPAKPDNESARLSALAEYQILDTLPEIAYDDITQLAAEICGAPIALVSLVDAERQWFKSRHGLDATETPRDVAFCAHAILEPTDMLLVEDAAEDHRFADNPLVAGGPEVKFYAGVPLVNKEGYPLGTLCVIDQKPKILTESQKKALAALGRQVMSQLELRRNITRLEERAQQLEESRCELLELCQQLEGQAETIERDLQRAEVIQRSLLPHDAPTLPNFHIQTVYQPSQKIGGDFFEIKAIDNRYISVVVADASGHGVSAAMLCVLFQHRLELMDENGGPLSPAVAMSRLNTALVAEVTAPGVFVTAAHCLIDTLTGELTIGSAGHPPLICLRESGGFETFTHTGPAIGLYEDAEFHELNTILRRGDQLLMFTDGLVDSCDINAPQIEDIVTLLKQHRLNPQGLEKLLTALKTHSHDSDDVTLLTLNAFSGENQFVELSADEGDNFSPTPESGTLAYAETGDITFLRMSGRVNWVFAESLMASVISLLDAKRSIILDLSACDYLDSTMLGTLHELINQAEDRSGEIALQGVSSTLQSAFAELSLSDVMAHVATSSIALPDKTRQIDLPVSDLRRQRQRLIKAHEALSELSDANQVEFADVIQSLKVE